MWVYLELYSFLLYLLPNRFIKIGGKEIMFEDLIGKGKSIINKVVDYDIQKQCPHCKTSNIVKRTIHTFLIGWVAQSRQLVYCPKCRKLWYIISEESWNKKKNTYTP